jgi:hypothetical protein
VEAILDGRQPKGLRLAETLGKGHWHGSSSGAANASLPSARRRIAADVAAPR